MKRDIPTAEETVRLNAMVDRVNALPPDRQQAFEDWLRRETEKATKATRPKRQPGRPKAEDPLSAWCACRVSPGMLREMKTAAARLKMENVGTYIRWLHETFVRASKAKPQGR